MNQIPNWFRWLVIVIATLIMCACQAPINDGKPLTVPIVPDSNVVSRLDMTQPTPVEPNAAMISHHQKSVLETLAQLRKKSSIAPDSAVPVSPPSSANDDVARVVQTDKGIHLQRLESMLRSPAADSGNADSARALPLLPDKPIEAQEKTVEASPAVYARVQESEDIVEPVGAQLDAEGDKQLGSPFEDEPEASSPVVGPALAPIVEPRVTEQHEPQTHVEAPASLEPTPQPERGTIVLSPIPTEQCLPASEIPIEAYQPCPDDLPQSPMISTHELARRFPDEYICDGGDTLGQVNVMSDWSLRNLNPEDTVGHFDTLDQRVEVQASNRVCIYAPRFAAVRQVTAPFQNEQREQVLIADRETRAMVNAMHQPTDQYSQTISPRRHLMVRPASSLRVRQPGVEGIHRQALHAFDHALSAHEDFQVIEYGIHKQSEKAHVAEFAAKAVAWSHDKSVQVIVDEVVAQTQVTRRGTGTIFFIGDNRPAKLRVIKTASTSDALPGEEVEFTLRFDNIGYQTMGNVTIIDNLTTRLEFIKDSDLCSVESDLLTDLNEANSLTLRWEITDPIEPGKGGLIRFRCRVR